MTQMNANGAKITDLNENMSKLKRQLMQYEMIEQELRKTIETSNKENSEFIVLKEQVFFKLCISTFLKRISFSFLVCKMMQQITFQKSLN